MTAFSNSEEQAVGLAAVVPLSVDDELTARGGHFSAADDFAPHVVQDGLLIMGQNPATSGQTAATVI